MKTLLSLVAICLGLVFASPASADGMPQKEFCYVDCPVVLRGTVTFLDAYGPPGFGETPEQDVKLQLHAIRLDEPISVQEGSGYIAAEDQVVLQLQWHGAELVAGKKIEISGTLRGSNTAAEVTLVMVKVREFGYLEE